MITWVVFLRMFWNFISSLPVKRGGSLSILVGTISNVLVMEIGWTDVGSGGYILVSCAHRNTSLIYNYRCNQSLSPLMLWVQILIRARCKTLCDKVCQWLVTSRWFSPGSPVSSTNKTDCHDITEILLKVTLNTIKPNPNHRNFLKMNMQNNCVLKNWHKQCKLFSFAVYVLPHTFYYWLICFRCNFWILYWSH